MSAGHGFFHLVNGLFSGTSVHGGDDHTSGRDSRLMGALSDTAPPVTPGSCFVGWCGQVLFAWWVVRVARNRSIIKARGVLVHHGGLPFWVVCLFAGTG